MLPSGVPFRRGPAGAFTVPSVRVFTVTTTAIVAATALLCAGCTEPQGEAPVTPSRSVITSTTQIAGAGVLGNQRRPDESCASDPAPLDPGPPTRRVDSGADRGAVDVTADPQRIVALSAGQLDALCALGLQSRVVGAALPDGSEAQPSYLGTVIHDVPGVGPRSAPDTAAITAMRPDLILGSATLTPGSYGQFLAIAPTVFTSDGGADWRNTLRAVGAATGRAEAARSLVDDFNEQARQRGIANDATHYQASIVQLTETTLRVYGAENFPASVVRAVGVDRPAAQRFTDRPYLEIGTTDLSGSTDFSAADGDIIYVSFASPAAKDRAPEVMHSDAWRKLSANRDGRVFVVNNEVWQTGQGLVAARGVIDDLRWINAPIN